MLVHRHHIHRATCAGLQQTRLGNLVRILERVTRLQGQPRAASLRGSIRRFGVGGFKKGPRRIKHRLHQAFNARVRSWYRALLAYVVHHARQRVEVRGNAQQLWQLRGHIAVHLLAADLTDKRADGALQMLHRAQLQGQANIALRMGGRGVTRQRKREAAHARQLMAQRLQRQHRYGRHVAVQVAGAGRILVCRAETCQQKAHQRCRQRQHQQHAQQVEQAVEQHQLHHGVATAREPDAQRMDEVQQRREHRQRHHGRQHIEQHMRGRQAAGVGGGANRSQDGGERGAHVGANHDASPRLDRHHAPTHGCERQGQCGRGGLQHDGEQPPHQDRQGHACRIAAERGPRLRPQPLKALLEHVDAQKQQPKPGHRHAQRTTARALARELERHANADERQGKRINLQLEAQPRHQPASDRGAEVGAEHHPQRRGETQQPGVDETNGRHGRGRGRLHQRRQQNTREQPMQPGSRQASSMRSSARPAASLRPSVSMVIPSRNNPRPPSRETNRVP